MKPKNRRINLTRGGRREEGTEARDASYEIPIGAQREIRRLIEEEGCGSTTEIAKSLNADRYPCAQADAWSANLVDSALRRQDMSDLKDVLRENRGDTTTEETASPLAVRQAAYDGAKEAISDLALKMPEIPPLKVDTFVLKGAVCDAVNTTLKSHLSRIEQSGAGTASEITSAIKLVMKQVLSDTDLASIKRVTEKTGLNVGDVHKRIDALCETVYDHTVETFKEHNKAVMDACENMAVQLSEQVDKRLDALEDALIGKFTAGMDIDLDAALGRVVDERLKNHLDTVVNQFAVMIDGLRREIREEPRQKGRR